MIPHRPPILCIDRIVSAEPEVVTCEYRVTDSALFPRIPATQSAEYWESGLIEGIAQCAAIMNGRDAAANNRHDLLGMLVAVRKFKVTRRARQGELITYRSELIRRISPLSLVRGTAHVGEELIAEGEFKFYVDDGAAS